VLKPFFHGVASIVLVSVLFVLEGEPYGVLPGWLLFGFIVGVGVDLDHVFLALIFNWEVAVENILSLNPINMYRDFMNGRITGNTLDFNQSVVYSSFHLITMILVNLLVSLYFPSFTGLSILVTGAHYLMDHIQLLKKLGVFQEIT
jgi:hypothetical protein|tara:strand:+ start:1616 stop:2053 length:438 start_codon:yes stop_codon:yes gene_type:complete